jgi:hypothetical protein
MEHALRAIFISSGLIAEENPTCRLIFAHKQDDVLFILQMYACDLKNNDLYHKRKYEFLKKKEQCTMFQIGLNRTNRLESSIRCDSFQTKNSGVAINEVEILEPYDIVYSEIIVLDSIDVIQHKLTEFCHKLKI